MTGREYGREGPRSGIGHIVIVLVILLVAGIAYGQPQTLDDITLIDEGFRVFTEETFDGNGRTCATCHIPWESYNIFPSTIKYLKKKDRKLVFADHVPGLENGKLVKKHALFNIMGNADVCRADDPHCWEEAEANGHHPGVVFRSTMGIFGLAVTTENTVPNFPGTPLFPAPCSNGVSHLLPQLGWSGDGSPGTPIALPGCNEHHGSMDGDADGSIRAFANGAIAQHNPKSVNRVLGVDFRFANDAELDAMAALQEWLGRRALTDEENAIQGTVGAGEFDINLLDFKDSRVALGRDHFDGPPEIFDPPGPAPPLPPNPTAGAGCSGCHTNAGANSGIAPGGVGNININTDVEFGSDDIGLAILGVALPHDEGASDSFPPPGPPTFEEAFNIQSVIESAQKKAWFHNHRAVGDFEEAIAFYITDDFILQGPGIFTSEAVMRNGNAAGTISFPKGDGIEHIGAFLRALNAFYNLRDCERLIDETINRINLGASVANTVRHCGFNLDHTSRVLKQSKLRKLHRNVAIGAKIAKTSMKFAAKRNNKRLLGITKKYIRHLRDSIAEQIPAP